MTSTKRERLEKLVSDMRSYAEELDGRDEAPSPDEIKRLNDMGADVVNLKDAIVAEANAAGKLDMAKAFLSDLAGAPAPEQPEPLTVLSEKTGIVNPNGMTLGEAFVKSPVYNDFLARFAGPDGIRSNMVANSDTFEVTGFDQKALTTGLSDTSAGAFIQAQRLGQVVDLIGERRLTVRDLCTNININTDAFEYVRITGKTNNAAAVLEATTDATPGLNNVAVGAYGATHGVKPQSTLALAVVSTPVETIAHTFAISRRAAADAPQMMQLVNAFLLYGLKEEEEDQILNGSGTSPQLPGILNDGAISTVGSAGTDIDAVVDAIRTIRADNREPNAIVVHPNDWYSTGFLLAKDSAGNYLVGDPRASLDQLNSLWGLRVVVTPAMTENTLLVGDFSQVVVADRQQSTIYITDSHNDHFVRNILDILAEERLALALLDPDAMCTVTSV